MMKCMNKMGVIGIFFVVQLEAQQNDRMFSRESTDRASAEMAIDEVAVFKGINQKGSRMAQLGIDPQQQALVVQSLNTLLANEFVLYTETLNFHWNVRGKHFGPLHEMFGKQYEQLLGIVDRVAERVRALGGFSLGTLQEFSGQAVITQELGSKLNDMAMIERLLAGHETIIRLMRDYCAQAAQARDEGSINMLGDLIETHEKIAWMLRSHLE